MKLKALSIKQPWAWLIVRGYKDIENRTWYTPIREEIFIHASKTFDQEGYDFVKLEHPEIIMPRPWEFAFGGIVGQARLVACVKESNSPWFFGPYGFVLRNAKELPFIPYTGKLGFFDVEVKHGN